MSKKTTTLALNLSTVILLNQELTMLQKEPTISFVVKYDLVKLLEKTNEIVKRFNDSKLALFKKYGECTDEKKQIWSLNGAKEEEKGLEELKQLIEKEEKFDESYSIKDFKDLKSEIPYIQIMKFMK